MLGARAASSGLVLVLLSTAVQAQVPAANNLVDAIRAARSSVRAAQEALRLAELACRAALPEQDRHQCSGEDASEQLAEAPARLTELATAPAAASSPVEQNYQDGPDAAASLGKRVLGIEKKVPIKAEHRGDAERVSNTLASTVLNGSSGGVVKYAKAPDFEFLMTSKDKVGSLSWTISAKDHSDGQSYQSNTLTLTGTAKLNDGEGSFVSTDGFTGGTEAKLSFTQFNGKVDFGGLPTAMAAAQEAKVRCLAQQPSISTAAKPEEQQKAVEEAEKKCSAEAYDDGGVPGFIERYYPEALREVSSAIFPGKVAYWGGSFGVNQTEFSYIDRAAFKKRDVSKFGFVSTAFGGVLLNEGQTSVTGSFTYRRRYKAADSVELCQSATPPFTQCLNGADGVPTRKNATILAIDLRYAIAADLWNYTRFAIAPRFSYDTTNELATVDVPVYLARDDTGQLRGGLRAIYTDMPNLEGGRKNNFTFGLFIGVPFSIFVK
ncbi:hypothetical protein WSK_4328 [Novosphingobium sp. Rr 2-17]|uniref:hypothetical protein n=1 Tax=Novosphingobium sp. Rr 2-17 TaxID=555793 RepID=UPI0002697F23|nr:hypothetical protein [Novosphingobium sp. Rr 2-17]EIZ77122.1 hypothetical protein WSK_4328 [Novosphingobium sp. Rr 2-17]